MIKKQIPAPITVLAAAWFAVDLVPYSGRFPIKLLSLHDHVANFQVAGWPHLLFIGDQELAPGPASIGLGREEFKHFQNLLLQRKSGSFEDGRVVFHLERNSLIIDRRGGVNKSFTPVFSFNKINADLINTVAYYENKLKALDLPTPASALLNRPGGDDYYRSAIINNYPKIIKALIDRNKQELIKYCRKICGMGHGLTPTGDDLIHAAFTVANLIGEKSRLFMDTLAPEAEAFTAKTGLFGRHMIEIGRRGLTPEPYGHYIEALGMGIRKTEIIDKMVKIGAATGFDLAIGITVALNIFLVTGQTLEE